MGILTIKTGDRTFFRIMEGPVMPAIVDFPTIVKEALARNSATLILVHNHPSGVAEPSRADEMLTQTLKSALSLVDVRVIDHLIVAGSLLGYGGEQAKMTLSRPVLSR